MITYRLIRFSNRPTKTTKLWKWKLSVEKTFSFEPKLSGIQPGLKHLLSLLDAKEPFTYTKINHGFWEFLIHLKNDNFSTFVSLFDGSKNQNRQLQAMGLTFEETFVREIFDCLSSAPKTSTNFITASTLSPWPLSAEIEGTPAISTRLCNDIIEQLVPEHLRNNAADLSLPAMNSNMLLITGEISQFFDRLNGRDLIIITNPLIRTFFEFCKPKNLIFVEADAKRKGNEA